MAALWEVDEEQGVIRLRRGALALLVACLVLAPAPFFDSTAVNSAPHWVALTGPAKDGFGTLDSLATSRNGEPTPLFGDSGGSNAPGDAADEPDELDEPAAAAVAAVPAETPNTDLPPTVKVCVKAKKPNPRVASLFVRNRLRRFGGQLEFHLDPAIHATLGEFYKKGILDRADLDLRPAECSPEWPVLYLAQHEIMKGNVLPGGTWMVVADEYCLCAARYCDAPPDADPMGVAPLRAYYADKFRSSKYVPLGPQFWFAPFDEVPLSSERHFPFNFAGSATSHSRARMAAILQRKEVIAEHPIIKRGFLHIKQKWSSNLKAPGYVQPSNYRALLLNSTLTLCPSGNNPEAFRLHEAIDAGSIPVLALDEAYDKHRCTHAFQPYVDSKAPFIFLDNWGQLPARLDELFADPAALDQMQADLKAWTKTYWTEVARQVDCAILKHHNGRPDVSRKYELRTDCPN